jgi:hypothetical protein
MSYIYKVFEHLEQLWMFIWQHTHTVTTTEVSPDLQELAEILDDVSVEMIPRCLNTLDSCGWAYGITLTPLPPQRFPQICKSWLKS